MEGHPLPSRKVGQLIHLKYLCLSETSRATRLPQLIDGLVNLQTLDSGDNYIGLPHTIWKLKQMRHLICFSRSDHIKAVEEGEKGGWPLGCPSNDQA